MSSEKNSILSLLPDADTIYNKLNKLHQAVFFIHGSYYQISKRFTYKNIGRILLI